MTGIHRLKYVAVLLSLLMLLGCGEKKADTTHPVLYSKDGVSFNMPGNWQVTEDEQEEDIRYLFIETPGDALMVIHVFGATNEAPRLEEYTEFFIRESMNNMPIASRDMGATGAISKILNDQEFTGFRNEFTASFLGQQVPHTVEFFSVNTEARIAYLTTQVATEDLEKVEKGFEQILASFALTD